MRLRRRDQDSVSLLFDDDRRRQPVQSSPPCRSRTEGGVMGAVDIATGGSERAAEGRAA
jgi:hypothetical protein